MNTPLGPSSNSAKIVVIPPSMGDLMLNSDGAPPADSFVQDNTLTLFLKLTVSLGLEPSS